ncbi:MAG TPA: hypothetical protein PKL61_17260, partial [Accumulibacter sp.]|uniref:hypothetical protein n=1 Tax=Accumulibacter sp. TaxID=2053492 RepID=UPI002C0FD039
FCDRLSPDAENGCACANASGSFVIAYDEGISRGPTPFRRASLRTHPAVAGFAISRPPNRSLEQMSQVAVDFRRDLTRDFR